jgi:hypothetical protein
VDPFFLIVSDNAGIDPARGLGTGLPKGLEDFFFAFLSINRDGHSKELVFVV